MIGGVQMLHTQVKYKTSSEPTARRLIGLSTAPGEDISPPEKYEARAEAET